MQAPVEGLAFVPEQAYTNTWFVHSYKERL